MGLFVRQENTESRQIYYTLQQDTKLLIVGLGNPGSDYTASRHNYGFMVIDKLAEHYGVGWVTKKDHHAEVAEASDGAKLLLAKPTTFMNESGRAVQALANYYKIDYQNVLIIHDELDLDLGRHKLQLGGSAAGHNGIKSIIQHCGADFWRLRLGIGPKTPAEIDSADFVLGKFTAAQKRKVNLATTAALAEIKDWLASRG